MKDTQKKNKTDLLELKNTSEIKSSLAEFSQNPKRKISKLDDSKRNYPN